MRYVLVVNGRAKGFGGEIYGASEVTDVRALIEDFKTFSVLLSELHEETNLFVVEFKDDSESFNEFEKIDYACIKNIYEVVSEWANSEQSLEDFNELARKVKLNEINFTTQARYLYDLGKIESGYKRTVDSLKKKIQDLRVLFDSELSASYRLMKELSEFLHGDPNINKQGFTTKSKVYLDYIDETCQEVRLKSERLNSDILDTSKLRSDIEIQMSAAAEAVTAAATKHIGSTIAAAYRLNAQKENMLANCFRIASLVCFGISAVIIFYGFWNSTAAPRSFVELIYRAGPILFFTIPAFYLARESNAHRLVQRKFQHLALNLPIGIKYIRGLDENSRHLIEAEFAKHLLMYSENSIASNNPASTSGPNDDLSLKTMISDLKSSVDKLSQP